MRHADESLLTKLKARLYLHAVLPAFEDLLAVSPEARELLGERAFSISFQTTSGLKAYLRFADSECRTFKSSSRGSEIVLHFLTDAQLNREFENNGFRIPIPLRGASRLGDLRTFKALSSLLETYLRPEHPRLEDPTFRHAHVSLQLGIALRAAAELIHHEPRARRIMQGTPEGTACFSIAEGDFAGWISWRAGQLKTGKGPPAIPADVDITFKNAKTALLAMGNRIDVFAALGLGEITVQGLVPLADALGYIFERVPLYIEP